MNTNLLTFLFLTLPILFHTANADAYNITQVLEKHPTFSTFNSYLTQSGLVGDINSRETITVLVVENHAMELLTGKPKEVVKKIMSMHVVLDFFDLPKLKALNGNTTIVTTLFQASGQAMAEQGLLKVTGSSASPGVFFSGPSGGSGSNVKATVVASVVQHPYSLSVVQISNLIVLPGIEKTPNASAPAHANAPGSSHPAGAPAPAHANAPGSSHPAGAPAPAHANAPGSSHQPGAPTPAHTSSPGSPHHSKGPSPSGADDTDNSPSSSPVGGPSATTPTSGPDASGAPSETPAEVPTSSGMGLDIVLATRLLILAVLWMI